MTESENNTQIEDKLARTFRVNREMMEFLVKLGAKRSLTPREVLNKLIWEGRKHAEIESIGAEVVVRFEGKEKVWTLFGNGGEHSLDK